MSHFGMIQFEKAKKIISEDRCEVVQIIASMLADMFIIWYMLH